jgi:ribA/ribD-fused uncharacterized protein
MSDAIVRFEGEYRFLSNFWPVSVTLPDDGPMCPRLGLGQTVYPTVEHAYQAAKTLDAQERVKIAVCSSPGKAKALGKEVTLRPDWDLLKIGVMYDLLQQKFKENPLRQQLLDTGTASLIEGNNWGDTYWGVCNGIGENRLGGLLMLVRNQLFMDDYLRNRYP